MGPGFASGPGAMQGSILNRSMVARNQIVIESYAIIFLGKVD